MIQILKKIYSLFDFMHTASSQRLNNILYVAKKISEENPQALPDFVKLLGRKLQSDYMCRVAFSENEPQVPILEPKLVWFDEFTELDSAGHRLYDLKKNMNTTRALNLATDIILPWPWNLNRVASCISGIGLGRPAGAWKQDPINHNIEYWLPFGIGWVHGGNHSLMTGIVQGQGILTTDNVYDISDAFKYVEFNGRDFLRKSDGSKIQKAPELEFAAIFEVGRLMYEHGISA